MDLGKLLESSIVNNDKDGIDKVINLLPSTERILELVRETKNYTLLKVLQPLLNIDFAEEPIFSMYKDVIRDQNKEGFSALRRFHECRGRELSFFCGQEGYDPEILGKHFYFCDYLEGVVEADNLHSFISIRERYPEKWQAYCTTDSHRKDNVFEFMGAYFAPKITDYFGYSQDVVEHYLVKLCLYKNGELLHYLCGKEDLKEISFESLLLASDKKEYASWIEWLYSEKIKLPEKLWLHLKETSPETYAACQADV